MSDFVNDTFTGSGNLSTHAGEIGASWSEADIPHLTSATGYLADYVLSGGGIGCATGGHIRPVLASGASGAQDCHVTLEFDFANHGGDGSDTTEIDIIGNYTDNDNYYQVFLGLNQGSTTGNAYVYIYRRNGFDTNFLSGTGSYADAPIGAGPSHIFEWDFTSSVHTVTLDGVVVFTSVTDPFPRAAGQAGFSTNLPSGLPARDTVITGFSARNAPPVPGVFWTAYVAATEVDA